MRYKQLVQQKLNDLSNIVNVLRFELNRNSTRETLSINVEKIIEKIEDIQDTISSEHDEFAQQFKG